MIDRFVHDFLTSRTRNDPESWAEQTVQALPLKLILLRRSFL